MNISEIHIQIINNLRSLFSFLLFNNILKKKPLAKREKHQCTMPVRTHINIQFYPLLKKHIIRRVKLKDLVQVPLGFPEIPLLIVVDLNQIRAHLHWSFRFCLVSIVFSYTAKKICSGSEKSSETLLFSVRMVWKTIPHLNFPRTHLFYNRFLIATYISFCLGFRTTFCMYFRSRPHVSMTVFFLFFFQFFLVELHIRHKKVKIVLLCEICAVPQFVGIPASLS